MPMPQGIGAVDLMIGFPSADARSHHEHLPNVPLKDEVWP